MATATFKHGITVTEVSNGTRTLVALSTAVIGLVATAADADATTFPLDRPALITDIETAIGRAGITGTLANYLRQTGAVVTTLRAGFEEKALDEFKPTLMVLSPGPGCPKDFGLSRSISIAIERKLPIFGVCLGLQGIVEHFGGELGVLSYPQHGKPAKIKLCEPRGPLFEELPSEFQARVRESVWVGVRVRARLHERGRRDRHTPAPCSTSTRAAPDPPSGKPRG